LIVNWKENTINVFLHKIGMSYLIKYPKLKSKLGNSYFCIFSASGSEFYFSYAKNLLQISNFELSRSVGLSASLSPLSLTTII
jgi:hypothetical protein